MRARDYAWEVLGHNGDLVGSEELGPLGGGCVAGCGERENRYVVLELKD